MKQYVATAGAVFFMAVAIGRAGSGPDPVFAPGDPVKGKKVYTTSNPPCSLCHKVGDSGGKLGPELTAIGLKRNAAWLTKYLPNPQAFDPKNKMPPVKAKGQDLADLVAYLGTLKGKSK